MNNTSLSFYIVFFDAKGFNFKTFTSKIFSLSNNKDPLYYFDTVTTYYMHIIRNNGVVLGSMGFKFSELVSNETTIKNCYSKLSFYLRKNSTNFFHNRKKPNFGLYIGPSDEKYIDINNLANLKHDCSENRKKLLLDLSLPICLSK